MGLIFHLFENVGILNIVRHWVDYCIMREGLGSGIGFNGGSTSHHFTFDGNLI